MLFFLGLGSLLEIFRILIWEDYKKRYTIFVRSVVSAFLFLFIIRLLLLALFCTGRGVLLLIFNIYLTLNIILIPDNHKYINKWKKEKRLTLRDIKQKYFNKND